MKELILNPKGVDDILFMKLLEGELFKMSTIINRDNSKLRKNGKKIVLLTKTKNIGRWEQIVESKLKISKSLREHVILRHNSRAMHKIMKEMG